MQGGIQSDVKVHEHRTHSYIQLEAGGRLADITDY